MENCEKSQKSIDSICSEKAEATLKELSQTFNPAEHLAKLSLTVIDIQKALVSIQMGMQEMGQALGQVIQSHNMIGKKVESLLGSAKTSNGADCAQTNISTPC